MQCSRGRLDAEHAVRAGLALIEGVGRLRIQEPLQVRIGVATGLVVVGDLVGSGEAQERGVMGETPNLAARLQGIAEPNTVVIAEGTRRLLGNLFELEDLGPAALKGIAGPTRAWAALRTSSVESRFEALHMTGLSALVGREEETELLLRRWARAKTGEGQAVLISGEAGKSRLTAAVMERLAGEPHTRLRYFCSPQHTDSALHPIIGQMERAAGLMHDDTPRAKLDKLDAVLAQTSTSIEDASLFAEMLSLPNDGRYPALDLAPQERRQRTLEALILQLEALARQNPVLMIFEDAHWTDPTSLEAFGRVVDRIRIRRVLLVVTFRLEFDPPWIGQPHVTTLTINRLTQREVDALIDRVVGNNPLAANIRQDIAERADGIPLFVEEITKAVLEAETEGEARRAVAAVPSPALAVPASLYASLMARLDRLGPAKEVAQIGAAIGRGVPPCPASCGAAQVRRRNSHRRWTASCGPVYCSDRACRRMRPISSSMRWCRMRLTAHCFVNPDERFTPVSPRLLKAGSRSLLTVSRSCWRATSLRPASSRKPRACGVKRDSARWSTRHCSKQSSSSRMPSIRLRPCPPRPRCVAKRSSIRSRS
jgi:hypothetical protein